jgi:hypothetical protein
MQSSYHQFVNQHTENSCTVCIILDLSAGKQISQRSLRDLGMNMHGPPARHPGLAQPPLDGGAYPCGAFGTTKRTHWKQEGGRGGDGK